MTQPSWPLPYAVSNGITITVDRLQGIATAPVELTLTADVQFLSPPGWPTEPGATGAAIIITAGTVLLAGTTMQFLSSSAETLLSAQVAEIST